MVDVSFYMLVEEEGSFSLALYDSEKNVIGNYSNLRQNVVNDYIENLENEKAGPNRLLTKTAAGEGKI